MSDQYVTDKFPTMERLALCHLREQFPGLKRNGFMKAVRAVFDKDPLVPFTIIPDGWFMDQEGTFNALEIEDRNPLSREKLWRYCELYDALDYHYRFLRLFVFDRYGHSQRELDLRGLYLDGLVEARAMAEEASRFSRTRNALCKAADHSAN